MTKQLTITMNDWVVDEIIGDAVNKSAKVEEFIIKGYMHKEREQLAADLEKGNLTMKGYFEKATQSEEKINSKTEILKGNKHNPQTKPLLSSGLFHSPSFDNDFAIT